MLQHFFFGIIHDLVLTTVFDMYSVTLFTSVDKFSLINCPTLI